MTVPRVSIGMPAYQGERFIREALDSIRAQTFEDWELVVLDDGSSDATAGIAEEYARDDARIRVVRRVANAGMLQTFRDVFDHARGELYCWASDHDLWDADYLSAHVEALDRNPDAVLAYPLTISIGPEGEELSRDPREFETVGLSGLARARATCRGLNLAGNRIYGLFRRAALRKTSVYPNCTLPDRLVLLELSVQGSFVQVPRYLFKRRFPNPKPAYGDEIARQRRGLFGERGAPWHAPLPTLAHALGLVYYVSLFPPDGDRSSALLGPYMAWLHVRRKRHMLREELRVLGRELLGKLGGNGA